MVQCARSRSSMEPNRWTAWAARSPYGIGWRITATRRPLLRKNRATYRERGLLPDPVRTAQTLTTGFEDRIIVEAGPASTKLGPAARTADALCITSASDRSEYASM